MLVRPTVRCEPSKEEQAMNAVSWARTLALLSLAAAVVVVQLGKAKAAGDPLVDRVRAATDRFKDIAGRLP